MTTPEQRASLKARILAAFGGGECPPANRIALHQCAECAELRDAFADVRWETMPDALIESHNGSLPLLSPEAFAYFLPAYLRYAIDHLTWRDSLCELTVYAVGPDVPTNEHVADWHRDRFKALTAEQADVVDEFLGLVENDTDFAAYLGDVRERRARFRELWKSR